MNKKIAYRLNFRRRFKRIYASIIISLIVGVFLLPNFAFAKVINNENIINITNETRLEEGLGTLNANQLLSKAAFDKAETIFNEQAFQHNSEGKKFSNWVRDTGYEYQNIGENLAIDFISSEGTMKAWLDSPTHKKNILNPNFQEIGVAVKTANFDGHESVLVVQIFGTPTKVKKGQPLATISNEQENNASSDQETLLTNTAPRTLLVANTNLQTNTNYLPKINPLYGQEQLSMEFVEEAVLYIINRSNVYLTNYYLTIIMLLLITFSSSFIWNKKNI